MAEASATKRYKEVRLQIHLHDVTIQFFKHAFPKPNSLPPVYLNLTRGSLSLESNKVSLRESPEGSGTYVACWKREVLSMMVTIQRERDSEKFQKMEVKFFLKICSKGKTKHRILGTCTLDISSLKLETLDFASEASERKQLMFHFAKKASNAIKSVTLVATFQYEAANDDSSSAARNPTMLSPSRSPQSGHSSPLKKPEAIVGSYTPTVASTTASSESESEPIPSPSMNRPYLGARTGGRNLSSKSKTKKLRSIFQVRRKKSKRQYSLHRKSVRIHQNIRGIPEVDAKPLPTHEGSSTAFDAENSHSLDTEFKLVKQIVHSPTKTSDKFVTGVQSEYHGLEKLPSESMATDGCSIQKDIQSTSSDMPDESMPCYHHSTQNEESKDTSEHKSENTASVSHKAEPARQEQEQEMSTGNGPSPPMHRIGVAVLPPALLVSEPNRSSGYEGKKEATEMAAGLTTTTISESSINDSGSTEDAQNSKEENSVPTETVSSRSYNTKPPSPRVLRKYSDPPLPVSPVDQERYRDRSKSSTDGKFGTKASPMRRQSPRLKPSPQQHRKMTKFSSTPSLTAQSQRGHFHSTATIAADASGLTSARNMAPSMVDLIRPVRRSLPENIPISQSHFPGKLASDTLGILRVRVTGLNRGESDHLSHQVLTELALNPEKSIKPSSQMAEPPSEGIYCALTINSGNTRAETSVQPILSNRPVMWEEPEEVLFYTKKTQQVFIMCRKTMLSDTDKSTAVSTSQTATSEDTCVGVAILPLSVLEISSSRQIPYTGDICQTLSQLKFIPRSLPLQPKGSVLLQASFYALQPRFRVSCKGTVTVSHLLHVDCNPSHELCCSARVDEEIQGCTSVLAIEDYSKDGWAEEPMNFEAHGNYDYSIHIWAYSPDETEYWCGGCTLPLGLILPENIRNDPKVTSHYVVKESCKTTITVPIEPQGEISLSFSIEPFSKDEMLAVELESIETDGEAPPDKAMSSSDSAGKVRDNVTELRSLSRKSPLRATLRKSRSIATDMRERSFAVSVRKSYVEKSLPLEQENSDLKKEVEYLREELRKTKAKLAEQQFFHEKTLLELRALQEDFI